MEVRKVEEERKAWPGLVRGGREPFWYVPQVFLHPAGCGTGTRLRDLKGSTLETSGGGKWWIRVWKVARCT